MWRLVGVHFPHEYEGSRLHECHTWLLMLSRVVMSVIQDFPSFVMLSLACVFMSDGLPSVEMAFEHGWNGGDG
jgi:hypothetical protein